MNRRTSHNTTKSPTLTAGDDQPLGRCLMNPAPFDALMDTTTGPGHRYALDAARSVCGFELNDDGDLVRLARADACPLRDECLAGNPEPWARAILGLDVEPTRENCGEPRGWSVHRRLGEQPCEPCRVARNEQRKVEVRREAKCGTDGGYYRHLRKLKDEPCEPCRKAHNEAQAKRNRRLRGAA